MLHIHLADAGRARSLLEFFGRISGIAQPTIDPHVIAVELPGVPTALQERREILNYLESWRTLEDGCGTRVVFGLRDRSVRPARP